MFHTVLVANRGEIAVRILRTLRRLGIRSVAVYSDADARARHVADADLAVRIGPAAASESYLSIERVVAAALACSAQAVHPGYGFLSENAGLARACADAGLVFIGPPVAAIEIMGDKIRAKRHVAAAGVPVVPGRSEPGLTDAEIAAAAEEIGFPVLVKPSAGGGGKGMRRVDSSGAIAGALVSARREARSSFGDDELFVERFLERARHIEVQILADSAGTVLHLGERECSLQRRSQKVIEEAPSPAVDPHTRERLGQAAVEAARSVAYVGVGTVEFICPQDAVGDFSFMEMNTRLQVEHPVTELVTGLDLVEWQLRVAAGEPLGFGQDDVRVTGHAVEARVYAEDPARGFLPTGGRLLVVREPAGDGVRVDSGLRAGDEVGTTYDPMLAKVVAHGPDRPSALARLDRALAETVVLGVGTNLAFLRALLTDPAVRSGNLDTGLVERRPLAAGPAKFPDEVYAAWLLRRLLALTPAGPVEDPWSRPTGWRVGAHGETVWRLSVAGGPAAGGPVPAGVRGPVDGCLVRIGDGLPVAASAVGTAERFELTFEGRTAPVVAAGAGPVTWLWLEGTTYAVAEQPFERRAGPGVHTGDLSLGAVRSPMPGSVVAVSAAEGDRVRKGDVLVVVEAMKMEHPVLAPFDGVVDTVLVRTGDQVAVDQPLAQLSASDPSPPTA